MKYSTRAERAVWRARELEKLVRRLNEKQPNREAEDLYSSDPAAFGVLRPLSDDNEPIF